MGKTTVLGDFFGGRWTPRVPSVNMEPKFGLLERLFAQTAENQKPLQMRLLRPIKPPPAVTLARISHQTRLCIRTHSQPVSLAQRASEGPRKTRIPSLALRASVGVDLSGAARTGRCLGVMALLLAVIGNSANLPAGVVVLSNLSDKEVQFSAGPVGKPSQQYALSPQKLVQIQVLDSLAVTFNTGSEETEQLLEPNSVHDFSAAKEGIVLKQASFSQYAGSRWLVTENRPWPPAEVVVPVKILVDAEQQLARTVWETQLRRQLVLASEFFRPYCPVRFEVTAVGAWDSGEQNDSQQIENAFRQTVSPQPGRLMIGVTGRYEITEKTPLAHLDRVPLFTHLLLPEVQQDFTQTDQLRILEHELGHFLGAAHDPGDSSIMRPAIYEEKSKLRDADADLSAPATLAMNLIVEQIRDRQIQRFGQLPRGTRAYLQATYQEMTRRLPKDRQAAKWVELLRRPELGELQYTGQWIDGTRLSGDEVGPWHDNDAQPQLAGRPLFDDAVPIRCLSNNWLDPPDRPKTMVEFVGGDRLPGRVVGNSDGTESPFPQRRPHLLIMPYVQLDIPGGPTRSRIGVAMDWVRRIVWKPVAGEYVPQTLFFHDGRKLGFRSARLAQSEVRLLRTDGIRTVPLSEVAELHFPKADPWEAYFEQLAELSPDGSSMLIRLETSDGLIATSSLQRFQACCYGSKENPGSWYQLIQPAWSLDPLWVRHRAIRQRRYTMPEEVPLSTIDPLAGRQQSDLGGIRKWQIDRNVEGGPLASGGVGYHWGLGVQARNELEFPLPDLARAFRSRLGLDRLAGEGGCVTAAVSVGSTRKQSLFDSGILIGSADTRDTGRLSLDGLSGRPGTLLLTVDEAHEGRPDGADPLDVRDTFDWLEPIVELDSAKLSEELFRHAPGRMPAWQGWKATTDDRQGARLVNYWDRIDYRRPICRLLVATDGPVRLSRSLEPRLENCRLILGVSRPSGTTTSQIEVSIDGQPISQFEVPVRHSHAYPDPMAVPLTDYIGKRIDVEVIQRSDDKQALVQWRALTLAGPVSESTGGGR